MSKLVVKEGKTTVTIIGASDEECKSKLISRNLKKSSKNSSSKKIEKPAKKVEKPAKKVEKQPVKEKKAEKQPVKEKVEASDDKK